MRVIQRHKPLGEKQVKLGTKEAADSMPFALNSLKPTSIITIKINWARHPE